MRNIMLAVVIVVVYLSISLHMLSTICLPSIHQILTSTCCQRLVLRELQVLSQVKIDTLLICVSPLQAVNYLSEATGYELLVVRQLKVQPNAIVDTVLMQC